MRATLLIVLLAACGSRSSDPAWPKPTVADTDGGESLAPRSAAAVVATTTKGTPDDNDDNDKPDAAAAPAATPTPTADAAATPTVTTPEEVIEIDDIVIEVDD